jgi:MarR family transcriptional regulator, organic hydroperoxide resistance regulator
VPTPPDTDTPDTDTPGTHAPDTHAPGTETLDTEITDAFGELFEQVAERFENLARNFSLPAFALKALHMLGSPMAMKELGQRIHCDPSFVTSIADVLDRHGLGKRETDAKDRRVKKLLLTPKGFQLRERIEQEMRACMPWVGALDAEERMCLLILLHKMVAAGHAKAASARAGDTPATGSGLHAASTAPPDGTGGNRAGEVSEHSPQAAPRGS